jgi:hypothetical protein
MEIRTWRVEPLEVHCRPGFASGVGKSSLAGSDHRELCFRGPRTHKRAMLARDVQAIP